MSIEWTIPKEVLEGACRIIGNVPPRNGIKASEYIKISRHGKDGASFSLSSDILSKAVVRTGDRFPFKDDLFLDRRLFIPFVDGGKESKSTGYVFTQKAGGILTIKHGSRTGIYEKLKPVSGYEDLPNMEGARSASLDKKWVSIVDAARDCATDDPITPNLNCVFLHPTKKNLEVFSSNGRVIFQGKAPREKSIRHAIAFPLMLIDSLRLDNANKLLWTNKIALIDFPKGKIWQGVKIQARKNFPVADVQKRMKAAAADEIILSVNSSTLSNIANRIAAYVAALSRDALIFRVIITKGSRKVIIESGAESSKFQESLIMLEKAKKDINVEWPLEDVMPVLLYCKDDGIAKIRMNENGRTCLMTKSISLIIARPQQVAKKPAKKKKGSK